MLPGWCCSGVMLQSDRFCRFLNTSVRRRLTWASNFDGMPYAVSSMMRPGSWLVCGTCSGAAPAVLASAPPVSAAVLRRKSLRLLLAMGSLLRVLNEYAPSDCPQARWITRRRFPRKHGASRWRSRRLRVAMGHLAERYRDASRSGVYRVSDAAVPRAAAQEAGASTQVVILEGLDRLETRDLRLVVAPLEGVAASRREAGAPFFAVLIDPGRVLDLPTLYKEKT